MATKKKTKKTTRTERADGFFLTFIGEHVELLGEFTMPALDGSLATVRGYLLDMDDEYFYVGPSPEEVDTAVKIDRVFSMQIKAPPEVKRFTETGKPLN